MDREGRRLYFIFGSAILEIVTPVFKDRLDNECKNHGNGTLQAFMNTQRVMHTMFHLRHRYVWCCVDQSNCTNNSVLPLNSNQWKSLYAENPGPGRHHCHCKYTAKQIQLDDLDVTLAGLILVNCCNLSAADEQAIRILRQYRNDYFAHNTDGTIAQADYDRLWPFLTAYVLQLDNSKQADLTMIQNRSLDESLCNKYATQLLDVHKKLDEINTSIDGNNALTEENNNLLRGLTTLTEVNDVLARENSNFLRGLTTSAEENNVLTQENSNFLRGLDISTAENNAIARENNDLLRGVSTSMQMGISIQEMNDLIKRNNNTTELVKAVTQRNNKLLQELVDNARNGLCQNCQQKIDLQAKQSEQYKLGQSIFYLHHQTDLSTVFSEEGKGRITDGVMMDGIFVLCQRYMYRILICNTDLTEVESIPHQNQPCYITVVNNSTVAVTLQRSNCIEMYDINNKHKLKSIQVPGMSWGGITTMNNKLVVGGVCCLYIINHQTGEKIETIHTGTPYPTYLHASGDRIFYCGKLSDNTLYCYSYSENKVTSKTLPSVPRRITSLQDGSLYVRCEDGSVQHVSSDGKHYKPVTTKGLKSLEYNRCVISYNPKQRKLFTCINSDDTSTVKIYREK